jgi:hypothetical protein
MIEIPCLFRCSGFVAAIRNSRIFLFTPVGIPDVPDRLVDVSGWFLLVSQVDYSRICSRIVFADPGCYGKRIDYVCGFLTDSSCPVNIQTIAIFAGSPFPCSRLFQRTCDTSRPALVNDSVGGFCRINRPG